MSDTVNVYEHQSTYNPNMPLRQLQYLGSLYEGYIAKNKLNKFGDELLELPVPKLVVFYNGLTEKADERILYLSDSFKGENRDEADVEVRVKMLNINYGHNKELLEACRPLFEYSWLIDKIRQYLKTMERENAVNCAIDEVPEDFVLKPFLKEKKAEVFSMLLTEYNEEEVMELFRADGERKGRKEGEKIGDEKRLIGMICKKLRKGKDISTIADEVEEEVDVITPIVEAAKKYAPDYDVDVIYEELQKEKD
jgi:hypothetical protein